MSAKLDFDEFGISELSDFQIRCELRTTGAKLFSGQGGDADQLYFSLLALEKHRRSVSNEPERRHER